jgi:Tol biopolymer transport system component
MAEISRKAHARFVAVSLAAFSLVLQEGPMKRWGLIATVTVMLFAPLAAQSLEVELQRAIQRETTTGDVKKAIVDYQAILERATRSPRNREVAATALLRIAEAHQRQGQIEARRWYEQLVKEYSDLPQAGIARTALNRAPTGASERRTAHRSVWTVVEGGDVYGKVSPDGRYLPYTNWDESGDLFLHDFATATQRRLTVVASKATPKGDEWGEETAFSRDSRQLAFAWGIGNRYQLRVASLDTSGIPQHRVLVNNPEIKWIWPEDWTPDGKRIIAGVQRVDGTAQIAAVSTADGSVAVLKSLEWRGFMRMSLSPDGRHLAYDVRGPETNKHDVFVLDLIANRELIAVQHAANDQLLGWSPDGGRLLFASDRTGSSAIWSIGFRKDRISGAPELLRSNVGLVKAMGVTSSGTLFTQTWGRPEGVDLKLATIDFDSGTLTTAPSDIEQGDGRSTTTPRWSRDGKLLAFAAYSGLLPVTTDPALRIRSMETGVTRELRPKLQNYNFIWTPQDDGFFAVGEDFKGRQGMYRIDATSGEASTYILANPDETINLPIFARHTSNPDRLYYRRQLRSESVLVERLLPSGAEREVARGLQFGISIDRQKVYARRITPDKEGVVVERDIKTGAEHELYRHGHLSNIVGSGTGRPGAFGDTGRFLAVLTDPSSKTVSWVSVSMNGRETLELIRATAPESLSLLTMSLDGSTAFAKRIRRVGNEEHGELLRVPIDGSPVRAVTMGDLDVRNLPGGLNFSVNPDGKRVAFSVERARAQVPYEVWVLENFLPPPSRPIP